MSLNIDRLDTNPPPTWDGVSIYVSDPFVDPNTALRPTVREDKINYFNFQREQGDLFERDLRLDKGLRHVDDFLSTRTGLCYDTPAVRILPGDELTLCEVKVPSDCPNYYLVGFRLSNHTDEEESFEINIIRVSDNTVVGSLTHLGEEFVTSDITDRGLALDTDETYLVKVSNIGSVKRVVSAAVWLQPNLV